LHPAFPFRIDPQTASQRHPTHGRYLF
jgi:hypothetical protein